MRLGKQMVVAGSAIVVSVMMLVGCNTVKGTAVGVGEAVQDTSKGVVRDVNATEHALTPKKTVKHHKHSTHKKSS